MECKNLKELFLSKINEIEETLEKEIETIFPKSVKLSKSKLVLLNGVDFTDWILNYLTNGKKEIKPSLLKISSEFNSPIGVDEIQSGHYIKTRSILRNSDSRRSLIESPLESFFKNQIKFNSSQIGFILFTKKLFYTEDFLNFLEKKTVLCSNPEFSLLNIMEEIYLQKEYPFLSFNLEENIQRLNLNVFLKNIDKNYYKGLSVYDFSVRVRVPPEALLYYPSKYKELTKVLDKSLIKNKKYFISLEGENTHPLISYARYLEPEEVVEQFNYRKYLDSFLIKFLTTGTKAVIKKKTILFLSKIFNLKHLDFDDHLELNNDFNEEKALNLSSFMMEHSHLSRVSSTLFKNCWSIQSIINFLTKLKSEKKSVIGYVENFNLTNASPLKEIEEVNKFVESISNSYWTERKKGERILVQALDISKFDLKDNVKELVSSIDLEIEGEEMNHCVGGYAKSINQNHRIFHIQTEKEGSTAELKTHRGQWQCAQHYASHNRHPSKENTKILNELIKFISVKEKENTKEGNLDLSEFMSSSDRLLKMVNNVRIVKLIEKIKEKKYKTITELTLGLLNEDDLKDFTVLITDANIVKISEGNSLKIDLIKIIHFIYNTVVNKDSFIVQINRSNFSKKDEYKNLGFVWCPTKKKWWSGSSIEELNELKDYYNNIEILPINLKYSQELLQSTKNFLESHPNGLNRNQKKRIEVLLK